MMSFYRVKLFNELVKNNDYLFHIIFSTQTEKNDRKWPIEKEKIKFSYSILNSKQIIKKQKGIQEKKIIYVPKGIIKELKKIKPNIIIGSEYNPTCLIAFFYSKLKRIKYISWSDGTLHSERFISILQKISRKIICSHSNALIASSSKTHEAQIHYGAKDNKIFISLLTIDVKDFITKLQKKMKKKSTVPVLLYCGYLFNGKGVDLLLQSLNDVKEDFILNIVGNGEEENNLKNLSIKLGLEKKVNFLGYKNRNEIHQFYKNADIFLFPTLLEAFGLVLVEALASGLPIISSLYAGAIDDTIVDGENGLIVDPNNTEEFINAISKLLQDKKLRLNMGKKSRQMANKFYLSEVTKGIFDALYFASNTTDTYRKSNI